MNGDVKDRLFSLCRKFIDDNRISCPEATAEDRVYENAPDFVEEVAKLVGFYVYPDDDE